MWNLHAFQVMKKQNEPDEFFIGWEAQVPPIQRRFLYHRLIGIFAFAFALAVLIPYLQTRHEASFHQSMAKVPLEGVFSAEPVPSLLVSRPGTLPESMHPFSQYLLVLSGKYGFPIPEALRLHGKAVRLKGYLIHDRNQTMAEVDLKSIELLSDEIAMPFPMPQPESLGTFNLSGEVVASKCYHGVHNPGFGKTHRGCAVRCIEGGVPPLLVVQDFEGGIAEFLILGSDGRAIAGGLQNWIGLPVRLSGKVERWGNLLTILVDPDSWEYL
jgi:hypothetical protein